MQSSEQLVTTLKRATEEIDFSY